MNQIAVGCNWVGWFASVLSGRMGGGVFAIISVTEFTQAEMERMIQLINENKAQVASDHPN